MKTGQWLKAKRSKYKHFYIPDAPVCDSKVTPATDQKNLRRYQYCPKCKTKKVQIEKDALENMHDLATRLAVALVAAHFHCNRSVERNSEINAAIHDLLDEAQAKLDVDKLIPDAELYKKHLGL